MKYSVIILAAGSGTRMKLGYNKMFLTLNNKPLLALASKNFFDDPYCTQIIYVTNENEINNIKKLLETMNLVDQRCLFINGGSERQYSVYNGLQHVTNEIVLVHDGARPFITKDLIQELVKETIEQGCVIPAVKVKDTIKIVVDQFVKETVPRNLLYSVQTPQACKTSILKEVHRKAKAETYLGTDEASLIERYSHIPVKIVESNYDNIKITTQEDINYANSLYTKYFKEENTCN